MENKSLFFRNVYRVLSDATLPPLENVDVVVKDNLIEAIENTGIL